MPAKDKYFTDSPQKVASFLVKKMLLTEDSGSLDRIVITENIPSESPLIILSELARRGVVEVLAVMISSDHPLLTGANESDLRGLLNQAVLVRRAQCQATTENYNLGLPLPAREKLPTRVHPDTLDSVSSNHAKKMSDVLDRAHTLLTSQ